jgi:hypothetical protein
MKIIKSVNKKGKEKRWLFGTLMRDTPFPTQLETKQKNCTSTLAQNKCQTPMAITQKFVLGNDMSARHNSNCVALLTLSIIFSGAREQLRWFTA